MGAEKPPKPQRVFKHPKRIRKTPLENRDRCILCQANRVTHPERRYHRFPKDPVRCKKWILSCGIYEFENLPSEKMHSSYRVCSEHFTFWDYKTARGVRLLPTAVPTYRKIYRLFPPNVMCEVTIMNTESVEEEKHQKVMPVYENIGAEVIIS